MGNDNKHSERDFHHGEGHAIPFVIKLAWSLFFIGAVIYIFKYSIPDLKIWLQK
jgi:hypothetical protein